MKLDKIMKVMHNNFNMQNIVSITSQGQLTIPQGIRDSFGISGPTKAILTKKGNTIVVEPQKTFWELAGSLNSKITLTDAQLKEARNTFSENWSKP